MSTTRYIQINSVNRNRERYKNTTDFEIILSQSAIKSQQDADDPVSDSAILYSWNSNKFNTGGTNSLQVHSNVLNVTTTTAPFIGASADHHDVLIIEAVNNNSYQQETNYYAKAVIEATSGSNIEISRIISSKYLGTSATGNDIMQLVVEHLDVDLTSGSSVYITDPTDFTGSYKFLFVPNSSDYSKDYVNNYILYNDTLNKYRPIKDYNTKTGVIRIDDTESIANWSTNTDPAQHSYSLRKKAPLIGASTNNANSQNYISLPNTSSFSNVFNFYKNSFIYIPSLNEHQKIHTYLALDGILSQDNPDATTVIFVNNTYLYSNFFVGHFIQINGEIRQVISQITNKVGNNYEHTLIVNTVFTPISSNPNVYFSANTPFSFRSVQTVSSFSPGVGSGEPFEIWITNYDNHNPLSNSFHQQGNSCYKIELLNLILPNKSIKTSKGGFLSQYPYLNIEFSNQNNYSVNHVITNARDSKKITFISSLDDTDPSSKSSFIKVDGDGMNQVIKFNIYDNMKLKITLPDGSDLLFSEDDYYSPLAPNCEVQVSALLKIQTV